MTLILTITQLLACAYVLGRGAFTLNHMSRATAHAIRYAHVLLTAGAAYGILTAHQPSLSSALLASGAALFLYGDRRHGARFAVH